MARDAQCDQVFFRVIARVAAKLPVMDLEVRHHAAQLTPPPITAQDLLPQSFVRHRIHP